MANKTLVVAESWDKIYKAFETISFVSYEYDTIKQSLLDTLKFQYPENFNDYIESSTLIALIELFAYIAEQMAFRVDMSAHENFITTAERKQSILKLAKLVSYSPTRNIPLRGLVKITSISCSENVSDSQGNNLTNREVIWNDTNNPLWKEQFDIVLNKILINSIGNPTKSFQINDNIFQRYEVNNILEKDAQFSSFKNGTLQTKFNVDGEDLPFEIVPADITQSSVIERDPNPNQNFSILYSNDGFGDSSDITGYLMLIKQGVLNKIQYVFDNVIPNRSLDLNLENVNDIDVWLHEIDSVGNILNTWENIPTITGTNIHFNTSKNRKKYEITSLENDKIRLNFGDDDFAEIPSGIFNIWCRTSNSGEKILPKNKVNNVQLTFGYISKNGSKQSCSIKYSLVSALQNASLSEDIEHIRQSAPAVYYSQNRMVNGQDYNTFMLKDPSILKLKSLNRTFAGQPKYINWNDASGKYQNVKVFGNDLRIYLDNQVELKTSTVSSRNLIDKVIEPLLSTPGIQNLLTYAYKKSNYPINSIFTFPRNSFLERNDILINGIPLQEKTELQGCLDRHWYGEPDKIVMLNSSFEISNGSSLPFAVVDSDSDKFIYDSNLKLVVKDDNGNYIPVNNTVTNTSGLQDFVSRYKKFGLKFNPYRQFSSKLRINPIDNAGNVINSDTLDSTFINQTIGLEESLTIEIINEESGTFRVYGSKTGLRSTGVIGEEYIDDLYSFIIDFPNSETNKEIICGDSFYITIELVNASLTVTSIQKQNLYGRFEIIPESLITNTTINQEFNINDPINSWIMIIERVDNSDGTFLYWNINSRNLRLIVESDTTRFFVDNTLQLVDSDTKKPVKDIIKILKSNLDVSKLKSIGIDQVYNVVDDVKYDDGELNIHSLSITPSEFVDPTLEETVVNPYQFLNFINSDDFIYFEKEVSTGRLKPLEKTLYLESLDYQNGVSGVYVRKNGRENIDFLWQHFTSHNRLIDPSPSNIIDIYVLTKGYYTQILDYLRGLQTYLPSQPTSLELRNSYNDLLDTKMISDTIVMHSGSIKLLFGNESIPELRGSFKVIKNPDGKLTDDQIKIKIVNIIDNYFAIENWNFGQSLHITELIAVIHKELPLDILSVVLVPKYTNNYFGDLFIINCADNEILHSCAKISDIEIVQGFDKLQLRQFR